MQGNTTYVGVVYMSLHKIPTPTWILPTMPIVILISRAKAECRQWRIWRRKTTGPHHMSWIINRSIRERNGSFSRITVTAVAL